MAPSFGPLSGDPLYTPHIPSSTHRPILSEPFKEALEFLTGSQEFEH